MIRTTVTFRDGKGRKVKPDKAFANMRERLERARKEPEVLVGWAGQLASLVAAHEYGRGRNPPRPFFRRSLPEIAQIMKRHAPKIARALLSGGEPTEALEALGEDAVAVIRQSIIDLAIPPNAPGTIEAKGGSNPLVDPRTEQGRTFRDTIEHWVE